ncbi:MAG: tyrosine--tRNA ligase [Acidobacteria bacterium]|nr:tyrosine--tRNA ligase [Acidobacteriota bacterium]
MKSVQEQSDYICKGAVEVISRTELRDKLQRSVESGQPLTIKVGFDPTAPDLHLGHTVLLRKMKHFQDLGHRVVFLIGDFTGLIGDPTGRSRTRPPLSPEQIVENAETYRRQVFKILDAEKTVVDFNSRWLGAMSSYEWIKLCAKYTVAAMLKRDDFSRRYQAEQPICIHEFLYSLAQAYDSVVLQADFELGGTDQKFNLLVGRDIQREFGMEPQVIVTMPILEGLDGVEKMSKSLNNYVSLQEDAKTMYGKIMSISDALMFRYYELLTDCTPGELQRMRQGVASEQLHPMDLKQRLARQIASDFCGAAAAKQAAEDFAREFQRRETPESMPEFFLPAGPLALPDVLTAAALAESKSEGRRLIQAGAVWVDQQKVSNVGLKLGAGIYIIRCGRLRWARVRIADRAAKNSAETH